MLCYRCIVVVMLLLFTAAATCSILFPLFRHTTTDTSGTKTRNQRLYWYFETITKTGTDVALSRIYTRELACARAKAFYTAASALSVAGAGFGGFACLLAVWWLPTNTRAILITTLVMTLLAFMCYAVTVALMSYAYAQPFCASDKTTEVTAPRKSSFDIAEGFVLMCVAAFGYIVLTVMLAIGLCCCGGTPCGADRDTVVIVEAPPPVYKRSGSLSGSQGDRRGSQNAGRLNSRQGSMSRQSSRRGSMANSHTDSNLSSSRTRSRSGSSVSNVSGGRRVDF